MSALGPSKEKIYVFTWGWLITSILVCAYFSFCLFPSLVNERNSVEVELYFQAQTDTGGVIYWPNTKGYREKHLQKIRNENYLYISRCDALPVSQRPLCKNSSNWTKVELDTIGCPSMTKCEKAYKTLSEKETYKLYDDMTPKSGAKLVIPEPSQMTFSDPVTWGGAATWPIFFVTFFLAIKLGRSLGEFIFLPYER